jgi:hypothetical protein
MKNWFNKNYKTLIITAFLIPILTVAVVSISHVTQWYGLTNPLSWAAYLSFGVEIAALSALAAISANMGTKVYFPFAIVTMVQFVGNIFFAYSYIDIDSKQFKDWVDLVAPLVEFMGVEREDFIGHKRLLSLFSGGMLPLISLSFLHMLVKFTEEEKNKEVKQDLTKPEDLKEFIDELTRIKLTEKDLKILEETLLKPLEPNDKLKEGYKVYKEKIDKETQKEDLKEIIKNDEELGLYDNPLVNEPESELETQEIEEPIVNERTQLQKLEDYVKTPQNDQETMLTTNNDIISSIPSDDEISDWDGTLMDGLEDEDFQEYLTNEDEVENISPKNGTVEFEIPEQEGWTEEMEQQYWEEQVPEPFATPEELVKLKNDIQRIKESQNIRENITDEEKLKPFEDESSIVETKEEEKPSFEVTVEKKNS